MSHQSHTLPIRKRLSSKLIAGFTAFAATAVIAASSFAMAAPMDKPTKAQCAAAGFKNYGQCVKEWAHHKNPPGHGYGYGGNGGNQVSVLTNTNVSLNHSNNNIINVITNVVINIFN